MRQRSPEDISASATCDGWVPPRDLQDVVQAERRRNNDFEQLRAYLGQIVENQIVPRLLLTHHGVSLPRPDSSDLNAARLRQQIDEFAEIVIKRDVASSIAYFEDMRDKGFSVEELFQDLLAPTARRLGELWDEDINDFMDVTRGFGHLQQIVHGFSAEFWSEGRQAISNRRALLMPIPGEQHSFGVSLVAEQFRREGWRVWTGPPESIEDITELVAGQWFHIIGLSAASVAAPEKLASQIRTIRQASLNKNANVFVGGRAFVDEPRLVETVGADATAIDGRQAVLHVTELIGSKPNGT